MTDRSDPSRPELLLAIFDKLSTEAVVVAAEAEGQQGGGGEGEEKEEKEEDEDEEDDEDKAKEKDKPGEGKPKADGKSTKIRVIAKDKLKEYWDLAHEALDDDAWNEQYSKLAAECKFDESVGIPIGNFADMADNEDSSYFLNPESLTEVADSLKVTPLPLQSRHDLVAKLFEKVVSKESGRLPSDVMYSWAATFLGFPGSVTEWVGEFKTMSEKYGWPVEGPDLVQFEALLADTTSNLYCNDDDLHSMQADMALSEGFLNTGRALARKKDGGKAGGASGAGGAMTATATSQARDCGISSAGILRARSRETNVEALFRLLSRSSEVVAPSLLRRLAELKGFAGNDEAWQKEYLNEVSTRHWGPDGLSEDQFTEALAPGGKYASTDNEVVNILTNLLRKPKSLSGSAASRVENWKIKRRAETLYRAVAGDDNKLDSSELLRLARMLQYKGTDEEWENDFEKLSKRYKFSTDEGPKEANFIALLSDPKSVCHCSDFEISLLLEKIAVENGTESQNRERAQSLRTQQAQVFRQLSKGDPTLNKDSLRQFMYLLGYPGDSSCSVDDIATARESVGWTKGEGPNEEQFCALLDDPTSVYYCDEKDLTRVAAQLSEPVSRSKQVSELFQALGGGASTLDETALHWVADMLEYQGDGKQWAQDLEKMRKDFKWEGSGPKESTFEELMSADGVDGKVSLLSCSDTKIATLLAAVSATGPAPGGPEDSRWQEQALNLFRALGGGASVLGSKEIKKLLDLTGDPLDDATWTHEFDEMMKTYGYPSEGPNDAQFCALLADPYGPFAISESDLDKALSKLQPELRKANITLAFKYLAKGDKRLNPPALKRFVTASGYSKEAKEWADDLKEAEAKHKWDDVGGPALDEFEQMLADSDGPFCCSDEAIATALKKLEDGAASRIQARHRGNMARRAMSSRLHNSSSTGEAPLNSQSPLGGGGGEEENLAVPDTTLKPANTRASTMLGRGSITSAPSNATYDESLLSRPESILGIFCYLDKGGKGHLGSAELYRWARLCGFQGSEVDWSEEYAGLCSLYDFDAVPGASLQRFARLLNDSESGGSPKDADLRGIYSELGLAPPMMPRGELIMAMFKILDTDKGARLGMYELKRFAHLMAFEGTDAEWKIEFLQLCKDCNSDPVLGLTFAQFTAVVNDPDFACYCKDFDLRAMLAEMDLLGSKSRLQDKYIASISAKQRDENASQKIVVANPQHELLKRMQEKLKVTRVEAKRDLEEQQAILSDQNLQKTLSKKQAEHRSRMLRAEERKKTDEKKKQAHSRRAMGLDYGEQMKLLEHEQAEAAIKLQAAMRGKLARTMVANMGFAGAPGKENFTIKLSSAETYGMLFQYIADREEAKACNLVRNGRFPYVNMLDVRACSALHAAAETGQMSICKVLLSQPNFRLSSTQDWLGWTALHRAARTGQVGASLQLLPTLKSEATDDVAAGRNGMTALHCAAIHGNTQLVKKLLADRRFDGVNARDRWGRTALHLAAEHGHSSIVRALLGNSRFEETQAYNKWHMTARDCAKDERIRSLLKKTEDEGGEEGGSHFQANQQDCYRCVVSSDNPDRLEEVLGDTSTSVWANWRNQGGLSLLEVCDERRRPKCAHFLRKLLNEVGDGESDNEEEFTNENAVVAVFKNLHFASIEKDDFKREILDELYRKGVSDITLEAVQVKLTEGSNSRVVALVRGPDMAMGEINGKALGKQINVYKDKAIVELWFESAALAADEEHAPGAKAQAKAPTPAARPGVRKRPPGPSSSITAWRTQRPGAASAYPPSRSPASTSTVSPKARGNSPRSSPASSPKSMPGSPRMGTRLGAGTPKASSFSPSSVSMRRPGMPGPSSAVTAWRSAPAAATPTASARAGATGGSATPTASARAGATTTGGGAGTPKAKAKVAPKAKAPGAGLAARR